MPTYRIPLTIASGRVGAELRGFATNVRFTLDPAHYSGEGILFVDEDENVIPSHLVSYDEDTGTVNAIVKLRIAADTDTVFFAHYD